MASINPITFFVTNRRIAQAVVAAAVFAAAAPLGRAAAQDAARDGARVEVTPQTGHAGPVNSVALSPDGRLALSGSGVLEKGEIKLWDAATGRELRSFIGHAAQVQSVAFSPDGRLALSGGLDGTVRLWDVATGRQTHSFEGAPAAVNAVAFSPDARFVLSGDWQGKLKLWDAATGKPLRTLAGHLGPVNAAVFSPDSQFILSGGSDKTMILWDAATGKGVWLPAGHSEEVTALAFSHDGRFVLSGGQDKTMRLWDLAARREMRKFDVTGFAVKAAAFSPDGRFALSGSGYAGAGDLTLWDLAGGRQAQTYKGHTGWINSVRFSPDGRFILSGSFDTTLKLWDAASGKELRSFGGRAIEIESAALSRDGRFALLGTRDSTLRLWDMSAGRELRVFRGHTWPVISVAFSPDGRFALSGSWEDTPKLWDVASGKELRSFGARSGGDEIAAFSPDGRFVLSGGASKAAMLWNAANGKELRRFGGHMGRIKAIGFSPDGRFTFSGDEDGALKVWDAATGREAGGFTLRAGETLSATFSPDGRFILSGSCEKGPGGALAICVKGTVELWDAAGGRRLVSFDGHTDSVSSVAFSPDGRLALSGARDNLLKLWDVNSARELWTFAGHGAWVNAAVFSRDGRFILSGSKDGSARVWDIARKREAARMIATADGEWLIMTPDGFFSSSHRDTGMLSLVRGLQPTDVGQVHQSLFNPDLVREALAGDPDGEVERAAKVMNLEKVLDAGPAPVAAIVSHQPGAKSVVDVVSVAARVTDQGRGVGRVEWRVNGVTAGVASALPGAGPDYEISQSLALDPGENLIEVIAYEKRNLLASPPARVKISYDGPADAVKPKLHILTIGINDYVDKGGQYGQFLPLQLAVADASAFGARMREAGATRYSEVRVTEAFNADATPDNLDKIVERMAAAISPHDTFVLYAAAHGVSNNGRFYMIPQDHQGGADPAALASRAIGQERLQDWIANRIKAKKAVILLDTCESGALINGYTQSRTDSPASEAAVGRLHEATGRPVLTAAAAGEFAREGYKGHGVFTYALMEALREGDANNNGAIELTELAAHVGKRVPELVAEMDKSGGAVKGVVVAAMRGGAGDRQSARFGATGDDFVLVGRLP